MTHQLLTYSGRAPSLPSPTSPLSQINGKKSKFIQAISENSRKVLIDKKFLDCEHDVPLTQRLKWQMSLEEALKMTFLALREKYTYKEVIRAKPQWHWDWDNICWHLLLRFEGKRFQWDSPLLIKVVLENILFDLDVSVKPMRGRKGCRELTRQTTPAPGVDKEWEMVERFLVRA